jgi:hypothetical protein
MELKRVILRAFGILAILAIAGGGGFALWHFLIRKDEGDGKGEGEVSRAGAPSSGDEGVRLRLTQADSKGKAKHPRPKHQPQPQQSCGEGQSMFMGVLCIDAQGAFKLSQADTLKEKMAIVRRLLVAQYGPDAAKKYEDVIRRKLEMAENAQDMDRKMNERAVVRGKHCGDADDADELLDDVHWVQEPENRGYGCGFEQNRPSSRFDPLAPMTPAPLDAVEADELEEDMRRNLDRSQDVMDQIASGRRKALFNRQLLQSLKGVKGREAIKARRELESKVIAPLDVSEGMSMEQLARRAHLFQQEQLQPRSHPTLLSNVSMHESLNRAAANDELHHQSSKKRAVREASQSDTAMLSHQMMMEISRL